MEPNLSSRRPQSADGMPLSSNFGKFLSPW
jgi:hypothetical protein